MKKVFSKTVDVARMWAAQEQPEARTGSNTSFRGDTLRMYGTDIARIVATPAGRKVALVSSHQWSSGTSKVQGEAADAAAKASLAVFRVPVLGADAGAVSSNIGYLASRVAETLEKLGKGRPASVAGYRSAAKAQIALANHYAETFGNAWRWGAAGGLNPDDVRCAADPSL